jgi:hypothetical protein
VLYAFEISYLLQDLTSSEEGDSTNEEEEDNVNAIMKKKAIFRQAYYRQSHIPM